MRYMRKSVFIPGLVVLVIGACLLGYGFKYAGDLDALIKTSEWDVTWYQVIDSYGTWGDVIGHSTLPARFGRTTIIYEDVSEEFGFRATMTIELLRDDTVVFQTGSDDGIMLLVDGGVVINGWRLRGYTIDEAEFKLSAGKHELKLKYYEWGGGQDASFDVKLADWRQAMSARTDGGGVGFLGGFLAALGAILPPTILKRKKAE
jgi:hypothetical protein